jgi:hypothetical protein
MNSKSPVVAGWMCTRRCWPWWWPGWMAIASSTSVSGLGTTRQDLDQLAHWLHQQQVSEVAMEVHGAILDAGLASLGRAIHALPGAAPLHRRPAGTQVGLGRRQTHRPAAVGAGSDVELCAGPGTARVAYDDPHAGGDERTTGSAAQSDGRASGAGADQVIQRAQRPIGSERTAHSSGRWSKGKPIPPIWPRWWTKR